MSEVLSRQELDVLGLEEWSAGQAAPLPVSRDLDASLARAGPGPTWAEMREHAPEGLAFSPLGLPELDRLGFELERFGDILLVRHQTHPVGLKGRVPDDAFQTEGVRTLLLDLGSVKEPVVVIVEDRVGLALRRRQHEWLCGPLYPPHVVLGPTPSIASDVVDWARADGDPWLIQAVEARLAEGDPWEHAVAVGLVARYSSTANVADTVARLVAGSLDPSRDPTWKWAQQLSDAQLELLVGLSLAELDLLEPDLEDLVEATSPDDSVWRDRLVELLYRRDDLEGVRVVLAWAGRATAVDAALHAFDRQGDHVSRALPLVPGLAFDERLLRASTVNPEGWWVRLLSAAE